MSATAHRLEFGPPPTGGRSRALMLAVLAHLVLLVVLTLGVQWRRTASTTPVQAELWSAIPKAAAPRQVEPPPVPRPPPPKAAPIVKAAPVAPTPDADIALQQQKERLEKAKQLAAQQHEQARREKAKLAAEKKREQEQLAALEKKQQQQELREKDQKEKLAADKKREQEHQAALDQKREQDKLDAEKKREQVRLQAQKAKEEQARLEAQRQVNLQRMAGLAGATGAPGATGTAQKASGGSSSYGGRVSAIVKPNIVFTETTSDNPTALVEVRAAPDGTIVGRKLLKSSGNKAWDDAVLKAIDKTAVLPRDIDGTVPPVLEIDFRRHE